MDPSMGPSKSELACLRPGIYVQLALETGQRFWCRVASHRRDNGTFIGVADDTVPPLKRGDLIAFEKQHVFEVI
jgi:hypothetical protein